MFKLLLLGIILGGQKYLPFHRHHKIFQKLINIPKDGANAVCNDVKVYECETTNIMGEDNSVCNSPCKCKPLGEQMECITDSTSTGKDQEDDCTTAASTITQNCVTDSCSDDESISQAKQPQLQG